MTDQGTPNLPEFKDGSGNDPVVIPAGKPKSRVSYWTQYFNQWGAKNQANRSAQGVIDNIRKDIASHQDQLAKYQEYQKLGLNVSQAISGVLSTITGLQLALTQKLAEDKSEGLTVK